MTTLYTWHYVALGMPRRSTPDRDLIALGYQVRDDIPAGKDAHGWDRKAIESYIPTDAGRAWRTRVEAAWEARVRGLVWWRVDLAVGRVVLGIPSGVHPEEVEQDLRILHGDGGRLTEPPDEDTSPGDPKRLPPTWRPWTAVETWIDCTNEGRPIHRGAYMRPSGRPLDLGLQFAEAAGEWIDPRGWDLSRSRAEMEAVVRAAAAVGVP